MANKQEAKIRLVALGYKIESDEDLTRAALDFASKAEFRYTILTNHQARCPVCGKKMSQQAQYDHPCYLRFKSALEQNRTSD